MLTLNARYMTRFDRDLRSLAVFCRSHFSIRLNFINY